ncbi:MAG: 50S ribosomal protein L23 [Chloroflexota bacterium]|nr:50S ribosomal protein L23 [Chloroflexota bacterium]MDE2683770.1 50S ribosomal protein L23 [Chloroflexota bacterium]
MNISEVLLRPTITEKSTLLQEEGQYTFEVAPKANKTLVKQAIERHFGVTVVAVNITVNRGKRKRYGPRFKKRPDVKKAVVTLRAGDRIDLIEGL